MRLAKAYTGRGEFVALQASFHGRTSATLSVTGNAARKARGGPYLPGVAFAPAPNPYRCRFCSGDCTLACADAVEDAFKYQTSGDVAAFIAEPVLGEGGIIVPHPGYFRRVKEILDRYGALFIADEVQSGFGRTGRMFAVEHYGVEPDIMALAKGIAGGFPLGAFIAPPEIADSFRPGEHLSTFGGNPVSCAAGLATIEVLLEERLPERAAELGAWCKSALEEIAVDQPLIGDVRGLGLMIGVELVLDRETRQPAPAEAAEVRRRCRERGILVGVGGQDGNVVRIQPPLVIEREDLERALDVLRDALSEVSAGIAR
jgi:4-aminobutyrate aminotransferase-like enzyme